jgi:hypothetical protein
LPKNATHRSVLSLRGSETFKKLSTNLFKYDDGMKILIISAIIVLAVVGGLVAGGVVSSGFFSAFSAAPQGGADGAASQGNSPGFNIKMGTKTGSATATEISAGDESPGTEVPEDNDTASVVNTTTKTSTFGGGSKSHSSDKPKGDDGVTAPVTPANAKISILPSPINTLSNSTFSVNVDVEAEYNVFAATIKVIYDDSILDYVGIEQGDFLSTGGSETWQIVNNGTGYVNYDITRLKRQQDMTARGVNGTGTLFSMEFRAHSVGLTEISFGPSELYGDESSENIEFEVFGGTVNVQ